MCSYEGFNESQAIKSGSEFLRRRRRTLRRRTVVTVSSLILQKISHQIKSFVQAKNQTDERQSGTHLMRGGGGGEGGGGGGRGGDGGSKETRFLHGVEGKKYGRE